MFSNNSFPLKSSNEVAEIRGVFEKTREVNRKCGQILVTAGDISPNWKALEMNARCLWHMPMSHDRHCLARDCPRAPRLTDYSSLSLMSRA